MREKEVEKYLRLKIEALGGMCEKFVSPNRVGVPDRLITWPRGGKMSLVETKRPGKGVNSVQLRDHERRRQRGVEVRVINTKALVDQYVKDYLDGKII